MKHKKNEFFFKEMKSLGETLSSLMYMSLESQKERSKMTKIYFK